MPKAGSSEESVLAYWGLVASHAWGRTHALFFPDVPRTLLELVLYIGAVGVAYKYDPPTAWGQMSWAAAMMVIFPALLLLVLAYNFVSAPQQLHAEDKRTISDLRGHLSRAPLQIELAGRSQARIDSVGHKRDESGERIYVAIRFTPVFRLINHGESRAMMRALDFTLWRRDGSRAVQVPLETWMSRLDYYTIDHRMADVDQALATGGQTVTDAFSGISVDERNQSPIYFWAMTRVLPLELNGGLDERYFLRLEMDALGQAASYVYIYPQWAPPNGGGYSITPDQVLANPRT